MKHELYSLAIVEISIVVYCAMLLLWVSRTNDMSTMWKIGTAFVAMCALVVHGHRMHVRKSEIFVREDLPGNVLLGVACLLGLYLASTLQGRERYLMVAGTAFVALTVGILLKERSSRKRFDYSDIFIDGWMTLFAGVITWYSFPRDIWILAPLAGDLLYHIVELALW